MMMSMMMNMMTTIMIINNKVNKMNKAIVHTT